MNHDAIDVCAPRVAAAAHAGIVRGLVAGAVVTAVIAAVLWWLCAGPRRLIVELRAPLAATALLAPQRHAPSESAIRLLKTSPPPRLVAEEGCVLLPAVYSDADQGYVVKLLCGADNVLVVLDSGSATLSVGTSDCVKASLCSAHDGAYRPGASPNALDLGVNAVLQYASLGVAASWWQDAVALPAAHGCRGRPPPLEDDAAVGPVLVPAVPIAAAHRMDGAGAANIWGLMADYPSALADNHGHAPVLETMWQQLGLRRQWALAAGTDGRGWLALGALPNACFGAVRVQHVPLSSSFAFLGAPCVDVLRMQARPQGSDTWRDVASPPRYAVLDCGTAESYLASSQAGAALEECGLPSSLTRVAARDVPKLPDMRIVLGGDNAEVVLTYGPQRYMLPSSSSRSAPFRSTWNCGDAKVAGLFGEDAPVLLLGVHHWVGLLVAVDADARRVGIGVLPQWADMGSGQ